MILNELSIDCEGQKIEQVDTEISDFLHTCHAVSTKMNDRDFYYSMDFVSQKLTDGYGIYDWLQQSRAPQKEKQYLRTMINRKQLISSEQYLGSEVHINVSGKDKASVGCLAAYETEEYVVSMKTKPEWDAETLCGTYVSIDEMTQDIQEKAIAINNCSKKEHVDGLVKKVQEKEMRMVSSGLELWEKRDSIYPHLVFCDSVKKQLETVGNLLQLKMVMRRLKILEQYFASYNGIFDKELVGYGCREESESVSKNRELRSMRIFMTPYGKEEFFTWHISFAGDYPGRIHFIPDAEHKVGVIGYVGKHLPTSRYATI